MAKCITQKPALFWLHNQAKGQVSVALPESALVLGQDTKKHPKTILPENMVVVFQRLARCYLSQCVNIPLTKFDMN